MLSRSSGWGKSTGPPPHWVGKIVVVYHPGMGPVPINAVCPECQNRFRLHEAMLGKSMRCTACQEVFVVKEAPGTPGAVEKPPAEPPRTRTDSPPVVSRTGNVSDFVPLIKDVAPANPPPAPVPAKPREVTWSEKIKTPTAADFPWDEAPRPKTPVAPKPVTWSPDLEILANKLAPPEPPEDEEEEFEDDDAAEVQPAPQPALVQPLKKRKHKTALVLLIAFVVLGLGGGGFLGIRYMSLAPERLYQQATAEYNDNRFDQARFQFEKFVAEYPDHKLAGEARFFADLSTLRHVNSLLLSKEDPKPAVDAWKKLLALLQDEKSAAIGARFAPDIWDAGKRLLENVVAKANSSFSEDKPEESEGWLATATEIEKAVQGFTPPGEPRPERELASMLALRGKIDGARMILTKVEEASKVLGNGSDEEREAAEQIAKLNGIDKHPKFLALLDSKEREVQKKAVYAKEAQPIQPAAVPDDGLTSLLFAPRFDHGAPRPLPGITTVFFCLARGVLYALDEAEGKVLWAARTGLDTDIMPVKVRASDQNPEMVLLASNTGNHFGITARAARDGRPLWHQPLAVPCQGPPVVVAGNAYVSLGDKDGTVLEIAVATGEIVGKITIGRALGPMMTARAGTGHLYIPADSRAVYVFDVDRRGPEPEFKKLEPILLGVMTSSHPPGSLRGMPVFSNPDPAEPGPKFFVIGQAAGLETMKIRTFELPQETDAKPDASKAFEIALPGWASFPPYCDGEKLAIVTDRGEFGLFGLAQDRNNDSVLFQFPSKALRPGSPRTSRGQVVMAEEGTFWVLVAGSLQKFRFGISAAEGVRVLPIGDPIPAGEPLHPPQVNARGDTFVVVTQDGMSCRATAVDALTGQLRWRRELGLIAKGDPMRMGDAIGILDQGGGFYRVPISALTNSGGVAWLIDSEAKDRWLVAQPARGFTAFTGLLSGPNGMALAVLTGDTEKGPQILIRTFNGNTSADRSFNAPASIAGQPVVSGKMLILPLTNGTLYRVAIEGGGGLVEGPPWRGDRLPATVTCYLAPIDEDELFATDGARGVVRWRWPASNQSFEMRGKVTPPPERPAATPVVLPSSPPRLVLADGRGNLTMWDADQLKPPVLKSWRPGAKNYLPAGRVEDGLRLVADGQATRIAYSVDGRLVWLSPDADGPKWVGPAPLKAVEGRPVMDGGRLLITDRAGVVRAIDVATGKETGDEFRLTGSHAFASAAVPVGGNRILVPLVDGTVVLGELTKRKVEEPKEKKTDAEPKEKKAEENPDKKSAPKLDKQ
jgi:outer membrane protein assembly factor BamB